MLEANNLNVTIGKKKIIKDISFNIEENDFMVVLGQNGSGKTTTIRAIMNKINSTGIRRVAGEDIGVISSRELARHIGVLMQKHSIEFDLTVLDLVKLGRYAYNDGVFGGFSQEDNLKVDEAMKVTGVDVLRHRLVNSLSGGEQQRVFIAQILAQDPNILILDEPLNHLDLKNQIETFEILKSWSLKKSKAIIAVIHDLNLAFKFANKALLIKEGQRVAYGKVEDVLTRENLNCAYDVDVFEWMQKLIKHWN